MNNNKVEQFPIPELRENLRRRAGDLSDRLGRSVSRLTSCDELPCLEYGSEIVRERALAEELFYTQECRNALERCISGGVVEMRYRWSTGVVTRTTFRKTGPNRVKVTGFLARRPSAA